MEFNVSITRNAEQDLWTIYNYIAYTLHSPLNAFNQIQRFSKQIQKLNRFPNAHPQYLQIDGMNNPIRFMPVDNYIVYFYVDANHAKVNILRVMFNKRQFSV